MKNNKLHNSAFKAVSLFSGCGGLDLGFSNAGFHITHAFDISQPVIETHNKNFHTTAIVEDLSSPSFNPPNYQPDILLAGSPCQGFSLAGKRKLEDPRNSLLMRAGQIALSMQPKVFLAENVPGVMSGEFKIYWDSLESLLRSDGYKTTSIKLNASECGSAQRRARVFLIAWKSEKDPNFQISREPIETLLSAIGDISTDTPNHSPTPLNPNSDDYLISKKIKPGMKLCNVRGGEKSIPTWQIPEVFGSTTKQEKELLHIVSKLRRQIRRREVGDADPVEIKILEKEFGHEVRNTIDNLVNKNYLRLIDEFVDLRNTFNGKYRRLQWEQLSYTVDTYFGDPRYFLHPDEHRGFTVREAARIQGFPDDFVFYGSVPQNMKMIGNAVSPLVAHKLAGLIRDSILA